MFDATEACVRRALMCLVNNAGIMKAWPKNPPTATMRLFDQQIRGQSQGARSMRWRRSREAVLRDRRTDRQFFDQCGRDQARDLWRLRRHQGGGGDADGDPVEGACAAAASPSTPWAPGPTATDLFLVGKSPELIEPLRQDESTGAGSATPPRISPPARGFSSSVRTAGLDQRPGCCSANGRAWFEPNRCCRARSPPFKPSIPKTAHRRKRIRVMKTGYRPSTGASSGFWPAVRQRPGQGQAHTVLTRRCAAPRAATRPRSPMSKNSPEITMSYLRAIEARTSVRSKSVVTLRSQEW